jgi:Fe2+ or Zn2+ uptake regulation protein
MIDEFISLLQKSGLRLTTPRKAVFNILKKSTKPLTVTEVIRLLPNADKVSIYRTMDTFVKYHIVTVVPQGWKPRYELAAPLKPHHHHMHCENCGKLIDVQSSALEAAISTIAEGYDFAIHAHTFEISGICQTCQTTRQAA